MIKAVGGVEILPKHKASCHCGAVELVLDLPDGIVNPRRCDCSICRRKGAIVASVRLAGIRVVKGADVLRIYQFNTNTAKHYFCSICGIYTHHQRRSNPEEYGFNVGSRGCKSIRHSRRPHQRWHQSPGRSTLDLAIRMDMRTTMRSLDSDVDCSLLAVVGHGSRARNR